MKVLIITYYWPPAGGSGVQRWLKFVKYLPQYGISPVVYTVENPKYAILDETLQKEIADTVEILKQPIKEPNNLLSIFSKKNTKTSAGFLATNPSFFGKVAHYIRANYFIPDARKFWVKPSVVFLTNYLSNHHIDAVITTGPPHSLHLIGLQLQQKLGVRWIADFRDPWTVIDYFHQLPLTKKSIQKHQQLESEVVSKADGIVVVSNTMKEDYEKYNKNIEVITNGFDTEPQIAEVQLDTKFTLVHVGLMNADRNPKILWKVLAALIGENSDFARDFQLKLIGKVAAEVATDIRKYHLMPHVKFIDYVPHNEVVEYQKKAQVLLLAVNKVPNAKGIVTGKVFEYLQAQRPMLAIAPEDGDLAEIISTTNSGTVVDFDDAVQLRNVIENYYEAYKNHNLAVRSKNCEQYHRKNLTKQLAMLLQKQH